MPRKEPNQHNLSYSISSQDLAAEDGPTFCKVWDEVWMRDGGLRYLFQTSLMVNWLPQSLHSKNHGPLRWSTDCPKLTFKKSWSFALVNWLPRSLHSKNIMVLWTEIRDWCRMMPAGSTLRNAYRARKGDRDQQDDPMKVPQSFSFIAREGWVLI